MPKNVIVNDIWNLELELFGVRIIRKFGIVGVI